MPPTGRESVAMSYTYYLSYQAFLGIDVEHEETHKSKGGELVPSPDRTKNGSISLASQARSEVN